MTFQRILIALGAAILLVWAQRSYGWPGVAAVAGALVMWLMLHFTRVMMVIKRAANRPIGYVDSAVMLNAKLRAGVPMLHVMTLTRSLGQRESAEGEQPEVYRWTDNGGSYVLATFQGGKLKEWAMTRPQPAADAPESAETPASAP